MVYFPFYHPHIFPLSHTILQRLSIAANLNDYAAKRRALSNLGNAYVFLGKYSQAEQCYM